MQESRDIIIKIDSTVNTTNVAVVGATYVLKGEE